MYNERILAAHESVRRAEAEAFEIFCGALQASGIPQPEANDVALAFWALSRGVASISCRFGGASFWRGNGDPRVMQRAGSTHRRADRRDWTGAGAAHRLLNGAQRGALRNDVPNRRGRR